MYLNVMIDQETEGFGADFTFRVDQLSEDGFSAYIVIGRFLNFLIDAVRNTEQGNLKRV